MEEVKEGHIFGLNELMLEIPRQTTVKALEDTEILYLN
jgi:CRP-like cAMP-binding protein